MKQKTSFFITIFLVFVLCASAQEKLKIKISDFDIDEPGLKSAWTHLKMGDKYFKAGKGTFPEAILEYQFALQYNRYNPAINYNIGVCCLYSDKQGEALGYFQKAFEFDNNIAPDIHLLLGRAYQYNYQFDKAIKEYQIYLEALTEKEKKKLDFDIERWMQECRNGIELMKDTLRVEITNIGNNVNSKKDDYNSVISKNEKRMYFTSRRPFYARPDRNYFDNKFNEDIYVSYYEDGNWGLAQNLGRTVNSKYNDAVLTISSDAQKLFLYRGVKRKGDFYVSEAKKDKWTSPKRFSGKFNSPSSRETTLNFNEDGSKAVFVSSDKKESIGGTDIFFIRKGTNDKWGEPVNLGVTVNTAYDEEGVYIDSVGNTLYFSSTGHNSMGGYDIFKTTMDEKGNWSEPVNLGFPINSPYNDLFYIPTGDTAVSYFSSVRQDGYGYMDIYKITYLPPPEPEIIEEEPEPLVDTVFIVVTDTVKIEEPEPEFIVRGSVLNSKDSSPVVAKLEVIDMDINQVVATTISDRNDGYYSVKLKEKKDYGIEITAQGYLVYLDILEVEEDSESNEFFRNFLLKPIEVGEKIILKNIFFEFGKAVLTSDSYIELGSVLKLMSTNPGLRIEISGHSDNVGSYAFNQKLSEQRAKAVVDYLVGLGIEPARLEYAGYASSQPVANNDTEEGRAQNRRVEFKILSK
jgi:outer membrane protein OmpA-like peptidoglycan-associated protein/tetratricopeptide (TPR) repeat protein